MGIIYRVINKINGKGYTGLTTRSLQERKDEHIKSARIESDNYYFHKAIKKYGEQNFDWYIIGQYQNKYLSYMEKYWIFVFGDYYYGYNLTPGGEGNASPCKENIKLKLHIANEPNFVACKCIETGIIYESLSEAQRSTGILASNISNCCRGVAKMAGNFHWCYGNENKTIEDIEQKRKLRSEGISCICIETNKKYKSLREAALEFNTYPKKIKKSIESNNNINGFSFKYL